jgi:hypothetical protein
MSCSVMVLFLIVMGSIPIIYSETKLRRQQKMNELQKKCLRELLSQTGAEFWVEMKKDGLKTGVKLGIFEYQITSEYPFSLLINFAWILRG